MKKLLFAISVTMFSLLGLHTYAVDAATTHSSKSAHHIRNMDSRNEETMPGTDDTHHKPAVKEKKATHKNNAHKRTEKSSTHKKHPPKKEEHKKHPPKKEEQK